MAAADAVTETVWLRRMLNEVGCTQREPSLIHEDNNCCILWSKDAMVNDRNKHIEVRSILSEKEWTMVPSNSAKLRRSRTQWMY